MKRISARSRLLGVLLVLVLPCAALRAQGPPATPSLPAATSPWTYSTAPGGYPGAIEEVVPGAFGPAGGFEAASYQRLWVNVEYLMWWLRGDPLPPLVTTGTTATGGAFGPGTTTLYGGDRVNTQGRSGGRITADYWLDPEMTWALEGSFFMLQSVSNQFAAASPGDPLLARPFFNTLTGLPDAQLLALPGTLKGSVAVSATSNSLIGADLALRRNFFEQHWDAGMVRMNFLFGFRYLNFQESVNIQESITALGPPAPPGTQVALGDFFGASNNFYGGQIGLGGLMYYGSWLLNVQAKLGLGGTNEVVNINGNTTFVVPGAPPLGGPGGLLALGSNSGRHSGSTFSYVPELDVNLGYAITSRWSVTVGYTLLYWSNIARPGRTIDLSVNPNQLPPPIPGGDNSPLFGFNRTGLLAQGVSAGLLFRY